MILYDRCSGDSTPGETYFGYVAFSSSKYIPTHVTKIIHLYHPDRTIICKTLQEARRNYTLSLRPDITYEFRSKSSIDDFAALGRT
jgi:hypothetical protein